MSTELVKQESLSDLLQPLNKGQKDYIYLRLMGVPVGEAMRISNRSPFLPSVWRADDPNFRALEERILSNSDIYAKEAFNDYIFKLGGKAHKIIDDLVEMGLTWNDLKKEDKPYVMKAVDLAFKSHGSSSSEGYEEFLLRLRRKV